MHMCILAAIVKKMVEVRKFESQKLEKSGVHFDAAGSLWNGLICAGCMTGLGAQRRLL